jgi:hypothetical protein
MASPLCLPRSAPRTQAPCQRPAPATDPSPARHPRAHAARLKRQNRPAAARTGTLRSALSALFSVPRSALLSDTVGRPAARLPSAEIAGRKRRKKRKLATGAAPRERRLPRLLPGCGRRRIRSRAVVMEFAPRGGFFRRLFRTQGRDGGGRGGGWGWDHRLRGPQHNPNPTTPTTPTPQQNTPTPPTRTDTRRQRPRTRTPSNTIGEAFRPNTADHARPPPPPPPLPPASSRPRRGGGGAPRWATRLRGLVVNRPTPIPPQPHVLVCDTSRDEKPLSFLAAEKSENKKPARTVSGLRRARRSRPRLAAPAMRRTRPHRIPPAISIPIILRIALRAHPPPPPHTIHSAHWCVVVVDGQGL